MKPVQFLITVSSLALASSCSSTYQAGSPPDDVYYSSKDRSQNPPATVASPPSNPGNSNGNSNYSGENNSYTEQNTQDIYHNPASGGTQDSQQDQSGNNDAGNYSQPSNSSPSQDGQGNTYITNNYYNDDYYDYAYSARLRRYYSPVVGYDYYDPYYTNLYWYDYNPYSWGVSIYLGYSWWAPSWTYYSPFCYGGFGYAYSPWGYHHPYHSWNSPYSYMAGYNHGFMDAYYSPYNSGFGYYNDYYNPYYYNSHDATSHHYGPRGEAGGNTPRHGARENSGMISQAPLGQKYEQAIADGRISNNPAGSVRDNPVTGKSRSGVSDRPEQTHVKGAGLNQQSGKENFQSHESIGSKNESGIQPVKNTGNTLQGIGNVKDGSGKNNSSPFDRPVNNDNLITKPGSTKNSDAGYRNQTIQPIRNQTGTSDQLPKNQELHGSGNNPKNQQGRPTNLNTQPRNEQPKQVAPYNQPVDEPQPRSNEWKRNNSQQQEISEPKREKNEFETPRPRQETRTPVIQPRNEPKQYREEKSFSAPRESTPQHSAPSRSNSGEKPSGGGRRK